MPSASRNRSPLLATPAVICAWKKLEIRVRDIADKLDGVMGVASLDLIDGRNFHITLRAFFQLRAQSKSRSSWSEDASRVRCPTSQQLIRINIYVDGDVFWERQFVESFTDEAAEAHNGFAADQNVKTKLAL
jgi:hypothetical protein